MERQGKPSAAGKRRKDVGSSLGLEFAIGRENEEGLTVQRGLAGQYLGLFS